MLFAVGLVLLGLAVLLVAGRRRKQSGLPSGRVVYLDTLKLDQPAAALYDPATGLTGRPDYLVQEGGQQIPVEVKSSRAPFVPYRSHVLQLAAYCHLSQALNGSRPAYGIVKYRDRAVAVEYTPRLEQDLLDVLAEIRRSETAEPSRSHAEPARCRACGYLKVCDEALTR